MDSVGPGKQVIKSKRPFTMQARVEVEILELLREQDPEGKYNCGKMSIHPYEVCDHRNHHHYHGVEIKNHHDMRRS